VDGIFFRAAWHYVVDNLPADTIQLRGALLVIMPDKMKTPEWKDHAVTRLSRIVELVSRLRFLMRLSQSGALEQEKLFNDLDIPKGWLTFLSSRRTPILFKSLSNRKVVAQKRHNFLTIANVKFI